MGTPEYRTSGKHHRRSIPRLIPALAIVGVTVSLAACTTQGDLDGFLTDSQESPADPGQLPSIVSEQITPESLRLLGEYSGVELLAATGAGGDGYCLIAASPQEHVASCGPQLPITLSVTGSWYAILHEPVSEGPYEHRVSDYLSISR